MTIQSILDKIINDIKSEINSDTKESNYIEIVKDIYNKLTDDTPSKTPVTKPEGLTFTDILRCRDNATIKPFTVLEDKIQTLEHLIKIIGASLCDRVVIYRDYGEGDAVFYFHDKFLFVGFKPNSGVNNIQSDVSPEDAIKWLKKELNKLVAPTVTTEELPFHNRETQLSSLKRVINIASDFKASTFYISTARDYNMMATMRLIISDDDVKVELPSFIGLNFNPTHKYNGIQYFNILSDLSDSIKKYESNVYSVLPYDTTENKIKSLREVIVILTRTDINTFCDITNTTGDLIVYSTGMGLYLMIPNMNTSKCGRYALTSAIDYIQDEIKRLQKSKTEDETPSDIYTELYTKLKANKYLTVLSSDTTEQFTTAEVKIDGEMYSVLYVKPSLYDMIKSKYTNKTLKFMNADLLLIQASLTEFIEFIKSDPKIFTFVKSEDLNQGAISGSEIISTIKYFNDKAKNGNVTLNVIGEFIGFIGLLSDYTIRIRQWDKKSPEDFISIAHTRKIINLNIISNNNLLNYEVKSTFNLFSFLRLYFGI